jgi:hypothetical protein
MQRTMGSIPFFRIVRLSSWTTQKVSSWLDKIALRFPTNDQSNCFINHSWKQTFRIKPTHRWWKEKRHAINHVSPMMVQIQSQCHQVKSQGLKTKVSSWCIDISSIKALKHIVKVKVFSKLRQTPKSRSLGQKSGYQKKCHFMRYLYVKCQTSIPLGSKDTAQVKVFSFKCDADSRHHGNSSPDICPSQLIKKILLACQTIWIYIL